MVITRFKICQLKYFNFRISNIEVKLAIENIDMNGMQFIIDKMEKSQWKPMSLIDLKLV